MCWGFKVLGYLATSVLVVLYRTMDKPLRPAFLAGALVHLLYLLLGG